MNDRPANPHPRPAPTPPSKILRAFIGAFLGIGTIALIDQNFLSDGDLTLVIGAFGATSVLVYGAPHSPLAQPYNVIVGHLVSAAIGVSVFQFIGEANWLSAALAVSLAIAAMQATRSVHPPGGASALIAVVASPEIHSLGFLYTLYPVGLGAAILVGVAWVTNNVRSDQRWPAFWF
ncbi:MAG: HPP family protein [Rhodospirillales bacterium]|jgi:CBS-domain-containing membrane protein|nr:HPP family protein [Rhodospirillales bacterium]